jgi:hypothetical protein
MKYSDIKHSIVAQFSQDRPDANKTVFALMGPPGGGKSAVARDAFTELGFIPGINLFELNLSSRDPVDLLGMPNTNGEFTRWTPPEMFYKMRKGAGRMALLLEEFSDAQVSMFNAACRIIYDRFAGEWELTDQLHIICTGNRPEDKSGAMRVPTKFAGRTRRLDYTENLEEWCDYANAMNFPVALVQYHRFMQGAALVDFDASRYANATPRTWEDVARIPDSLPLNLQQENAAGSVGSGRAAEYIGFKQIMNDLPHIPDILKKPTEIALPTRLDVKYAVMGALARAATAANFDAVCAYSDRFEPDLRVTCIKDAIKKDPAIKKTKAYYNWAAANADVLV